MARSMVQEAVWNCQAEAPRITIQEVTGKRSSRFQSPDG